MLRKRLMMIAAAMSLASCAAVSAGLALADAVQQVAGTPASEARGHTASAIGETVQLKGTQAMILANNAYQIAAAGAAVYVRSPAATEENVNRIERLNLRATQLLTVGDRGLTLAQRAAEVMNIVAELNLFGRR